MADAERHPTEPRAAIRAEACVIGAGAAGMWAAEALGRGGVDTLVLEKMPRTGTKVLASGGTKCNLTTTLPGREAAMLFGKRGARFLRHAFRVLSPADVRQRFAAWGVETVQAPLEKIFPATGKAVHVRDALRDAAKRAGAQFVLGARVVALDSTADGEWRIALEDGRSIESRTVIVCPGGKSYASLGTTGDGYAWLEALGCTIVPTVPALVPLTSEDRGVTDLTGIAIQGANASLAAADRPSNSLGERLRPVLFTHRGVSGPGAMDLSVHVARAVQLAEAENRERPRFILRIDLAAATSREALRSTLIDAAGEPGNPKLSRALPFDLPKRLVQAVCARAGLDEEPRTGGLSKAARHRLIESIKAFPVPIDGTLGFDKAEVTAGGLDLTEVDPGTMALRRAPGLYACGEILDLSGPIGGLNFQSAFATAEVAAQAILSSTGGRRP